MKNYWKIEFVALLAVIGLCSVALSAQKTTFSQREVRDPRLLERHLAANALDAETRLAAMEAGKFGAVGASTVTNGAVITLSAVVNNVTASEAATNTLANPGTAGRIAILANVGTNNITIAKSANIALSGATVVITPHGTLTLVATTTAAWKELSNSKDNAVD